MRHTVFMSSIAGALIGASYVLSTFHAPWFTGSSIAAGLLALLACAYALIDISNKLSDR